MTKGQMKSKKDKQKASGKIYRDKQTNMQVDTHTFKYFLSDEVGQMKNVDV